MLILVDYNFHTVFREQLTAIVLPSPDQMQQTMDAIPTVQVQMKSAPMKYLLTLLTIHLDVVIQQAPPLHLLQMVPVGLVQSGVGLLQHWQQVFQLRLP